MRLQTRNTVSISANSRLSLAVIAISASLALLSGCAHQSMKGGSESGDQVSANANESSKNGEGTVTISSEGDIYVRGMKLQNSKFDYPVTINTRVEYWIDYFTGRGRKHFIKYLERSELFIPYIKPLLRQNGLPEDLVYLAMIESGFNNHARSHAKAVGPWQFISATGKRYGLMVNWWVDERRDTHKSTLAAVGYLRDLYGMFQSWELAAAAYNSGEAKIARAIRRFGTKDFWTIARHRFLRPETRDYVPKIIAAAIVAKNRTQFGFPAETIVPGNGEIVAGNGEVVKVEPEAAQPAPLAQKEAISSVIKADDVEITEDVDSEDATEAGPMAASLVTASMTVTPDGVSAGGERLAKPVQTPHVSKKGEISGEELVEFDVQSPADLLAVSRAAGLSYHTVKSLNPELLRWCTPPNVGNYRIKLPSSVKDKFLAEYNNPSFPRKVQFMAYKAKGGDSLAKIARHLGIRVDPIADLNGISSKVSLRKGTQVVLPIPNDRSRTLASLEVRDPPEKRRKRKGTRRYYKVSYKKREAARVRVDNDT